MVKTVLSVSHQGLRDWLIQRISAVVMVVYFTGLIGYLMMHPNLAYADWKSLFGHAWFKVATILVVLSLLFHAWVGMWTIFTDYVTCYVVRLTLHTVVFFSLVAMFIATLMILWGI